MKFELPELKFDTNSLGSWTSAETFEYHHGKHHASYVKKLNAAIEGTEFADQSLDEIIKTSRSSNPGVFNNAAQHFNHSFFWNCLSAESQEVPERFKNIKDEFSEKAAKLFGSGWCWLVLNNGELKIEQYKDADTPAGTDKTPLLTLDVWEHAYYIDHRNNRGGFIEGFWEHVNWSFVEKQLG